MLETLQRLRQKLALARRRPGFFSPFGGLWTDRLDAPERLARRLERGGLSPADGELLERWCRDGYVVLERAVPDEITDAIAAGIESAWTDPACPARIELDGVLHAPEPGLRRQPCKLVDQFAWSNAALEASFAPPLQHFLKLVFEREPLLFQSLTFERGSRQDIHQDTAYVVVTRPMELVASWLALEDIRPGSGELQYYVGSHRLEPFLFGRGPLRRGRRNYNREKDGDELHREFLAGLHTRSRARGLRLESFLPRKGDLLVWSADLAHGGAPVQDPELTRKSYVSHYCPDDARPYWFTYRPEQRTLRRLPGRGSYCSSHFALERNPTSSRPT